MDQSSFFSSAQATRLPVRSKYIPLLRPAGWRNVERVPSTLHFRIRSLGWSVKKTFPAASAVGPSVKEKSPASFSTVAPGARRSSEATAGRATASATRAETTMRLDLRGISCVLLQEIASMVPSSLGAKRLHGIDPGGAPGRDQTGQHGDGDE